MLPFLTRILKEIKERIVIGLLGVFPFIICLKTLINPPNILFIPLSLNPLMKSLIIIFSKYGRKMMGGV